MPTPVPSLEQSGFVAGDTGRCDRLGPDGVRVIVIEWDGALRPAVAECSRLDHFLGDRLPPRERLVRLRPVPSADGPCSGVKSPQPTALESCRFFSARMGSVWPNLAAWGAPGGES